MQNAIQETLTFIEDAEARKTALETSDNGQTVYLALWSAAFHNASDAVPLAAPLITDSLAERRAAAAYLLGQLGTREALVTLLPALDDPDIRIAAMAFPSLSRTEYNYHTGRSVSALADADLFERIERNLTRFAPTPAEPKPILFPWLKPTLEQASAANCLPNLIGERPLSRLLPYLPMMDANGRAQVCRLYADEKRPRTDENRDVLIAFLGDASSYVRDTALEALKRYAQDDPVILAQYEKLLTRKAADLRKGIIELLLKRKDDGVLESADRLLESKNANQRVAGLDLLTQLVKADRSAEPARTRAAGFAQKRANPTEAEEALLKPLLSGETETATLQNALGLMNPAERTPSVVPAAPKPLPLLKSPSSEAILKELVAFIETNKERTIRVTDWNGTERETLLGNPDYSFPNPNSTLPLEEDLKRLTIAEDLQAWWDARPESMRDSDGLELLRFGPWFSEIESPSQRQWRTRRRRDDDEDTTPEPAPQPVSLTDEQYRVAGFLYSWLVRMTGRPAGTVEFLLDAAAVQLAVLAETLEKTTNLQKRIQHRYNTGTLWIYLARRDFQQYHAEWSPAQITRLWEMICWVDRPAPDLPRQRPDLNEAVYAFRAGAATEADIYDYLLGERVYNPEWGYIRDNFSPLQSLSGRKDHALFAEAPQLKAMVENCRQRILDVELVRGDTPTVVTPAAQVLRYTGGMDTLIRTAKAFGKENFIRGYTWGDTRAAIFSRILRATFPGPDDTPEAFADAVKEAGISEQRLVEIAMYAPQWTRHAEQALGWESFAEGVWWLHAHTKDDHWSVDTDIREAWTAEISDKTPLSAEDLVEGAVDVAWFWRVWNTLGAERWAALDAAAKYTSSSGGHKRAQLFADAMRGQADRDAMLTQIKDKRNKDAVRALGLLPLPEDPAERKADALARYEVIQEFLRTSKKFGAQRQESEKKASRIAMENLARTAGYPDPVRLEWAMETEAVADLATGSVSATAGEVEVTLSINLLGEPDLSVMKKGKAVQSIPPAAKKDPAIAVLVERRKSIERQVSRMRLSLEEAMVRGDGFTPAELAELHLHPVLLPMLRSLVFVTDEEMPRLGYPVEKGTELEDFDGQRTPLPDSVKVRIAHPYDLLQAGNWERWQRDCFLRERVQPCKQVFRELYVLTEQERADGVKSSRYSGHQVNPKQAMALFGKRGWISLQEEGDVRKTFHQEGVSAYVEFMGWTDSPLDVEGLTLDTVFFTKRGEYKPLRLVDVPPRLFCEAMRDLDLVVSVAHLGGVDPEASASTVEMREALVREAAALLKLDNVRFGKSHVLIDGKLATYSVHLGSAIVHRQPGGFVCIVPSFASQRGRLFLPFADSDPRTAEVVSKVLLLAKDSEIKDPTILEQLLGR
ncbi:MAG: DUF4132 domain-containing protein [Armatimonadaceae bacterium]